MNRRVSLVVVAVLMVFALAGCSNKSKGTSAGGVTATTAAASAGPTTVNVVGGETPDGKLHLTVTPASVNAGPTTITFKNAGTMVHEVVVLKTDVPPDKLKVGADHKVSESSSVGEVSETERGKTKSTTIDMKPGKYVLVCNIAGHYELGMFTAFSVS
jgi:uncharacterized cupredoxin-like copper-binding protein